MKQLLLPLLLICSTLTLSAQDCEIFNLVTEAHECINGEFMVDIDFDVENPVDSMFGVVGNATNYGEFLYEDLPITVGPITGDSDTEWFFIVYDLDEAECQATDTLGIVNCCGFSEVSIDPQECQNQEEFSAVINFEYENTGNLGFDVFDINGNSIGFYLYEDLPVTVTGIPSTGNQLNEITICDNDNENCCLTVEFEGLDCDPEDCEIYNVVADAGDCDDGVFYVTLNFDFENVTELFSVMGNGNNYGLFSYDSLPITIGPLEGDGETVWEFVVKDNTIDGCEDFTVLEPIDCPEVCGFNDVVIEPFECQGDSAYSVDLDFIPIATSDEGFAVYAGDEFIDEYSYEDLPITIEFFPASGDFFDTLVICDLVDPDCCEAFQFQALACGECLIYNIEVDATECDSNMQFFVELDFDFENVSDEGFQVGGNGNIYGEWDYDELPVIVGPLDGDDSTIYEFVVLDLGGGLCLAGVELGTVDCFNPCEIWDIEVDFLECTGDGTYNLWLDFEYENTGELGFDVFANGEFFGFYTYDELPLILSDFPASGNDNDWLEICDNDNFNCCEVLEFESPGCFEECDIRDLVADPLECTSDSTFSVFIAFVYEHLPGDSVDIYGNGDYVGTYSVASLPLTIPDFPAPVGDSGVHLLVCATGDENCCEDIEFLGPICDTSACAIFDLVLDEKQCDDDGTFSMYIDFEYQGLENDFFEVWNDGEFIGFYALDSLPVLVDGLPGEGGISVLTICENDNDACCFDFEYEAPVCEVECSIFDIVLDGIECTDEGEFSMWLNFEYQGATNDFFEVWNGDDYIGFYALDSLPVYLEGIPGGDGENAVLAVCVNDNEECCNEIEYETPDCIDECSISELIVDGLECYGDDGYFSMWINFDYEGVANDFFEVWIDDTYYGLYAFDSLPVMIDEIPGTGEAASLLVCENDNDGCCADLSFETPDCNTCTISELTAEAVECSSDSTFSAWVDFESSGVSADGVDIYADGDYLGFFPLVTPILVPNMPAGDGVLEIEVCSADSLPEPLCCAVTELEQLFCEEDVCPIGEVTAEPSECDSNGMFFVELNIELLAPVDGGFLVAGNGSTYGSFDYDDLPVTIGPLEGDGETEWEFIAIDLADTECSNFVELGTIDCETTGIFGPGPEVYNLDVRYGTDGPFFIVPEHAESATLWTSAGQLAATIGDLAAGNAVALRRYSADTGVMILTVESTRKALPGQGCDVLIDYILACLSG